MIRLLTQARAQEMRRNGESIGVIAQELKISKSTASLWCRDISLSKKQIAVLNGRRASAGLRAILASAEKKRAERMENERRFNRMGQHDVGRLSARDLFILGLGLYWGEGYKRGNEEVGFTNSDPDMIRKFILWLEKAYGIDTSKLILRVSINALHKNKITEITSYWAKVTNVSKTQFTKPSFIKTPTKKVYESRDTYYGVLRVKVRNGTNLRRRILGSINKLKQ